jgi:hypothetical protein
VLPEIEPPSVQATAEALERLRMSEAIRGAVLPEHTYPLRAEDEETVELFYEAFGELPPANYLKRLWWFLRS